VSIEISTHGMGMDIRRVEDRFFIEIDFYGKLRHEDYEVMIPVIERALEAKGEREFDLLVDMRDFEGWTFEAAIDDMRFGLSFKDSFDAMAVVGDREWEELSVKLMNHLCRGELRFFEDYDEALRWLLQR